jgi:hypothetical protein
MSGHVKRRLSPGSSALNSRRQTAFKNIEKHLKSHDQLDVSEIEKHKKEMDILKERLA